MPHELVWNKKHTKLKVRSTIVDGYICGVMTPEEMLKTKHRDLVLRGVYNVCPWCNCSLVGTEYDQKSSLEEK